MIQRALNVKKEFVCACEREYVYVCIFLRWWIKIWGVPISIRVEQFYGRRIKLKADTFNLVNSSSFSENKSNNNSKEIILLFANVIDALKLYEKIIQNLSDRNASIVDVILIMKLLRTLLLNFSYIRCFRFWNIS